MFCRRASAETLVAVMAAFSIPFDHVLSLLQDSDTGQSVDIDSLVVEWKQRKMATSACPKCGGTFFEVKLNSPRDSNYQLLFVQCSSCGSVVGVMDAYNIGAQTDMIKERLDDLERQIRQIKK